MAPLHEEIEYGQRIASIHLIKFEEGKEVITGYAEEHGQIDTLSKDRRPPTPERTLYDWIEMSRKLDGINKDVKMLKTLIYGIIIGVVAGCIAGLVIANI